MATCGDLTNDALLDPPGPEARAHLDTCADCRARAAELRALAGELRELGRAEPAADDPALVRKILSRLPKKGAPRARVRSPSPWRWVAAAAAAAVVAAGVVLATREPERPENPRETPKVVGTTEKPRESPRVPAPTPVPAPAPREPEAVPAPRPPATAPKSPEPPAAPSEPKPAEPGKPSPGPAEPPKPPAPPTKAKPTRIVVAILSVEGNPEINGRKIEKGSDWAKDSTLRAGDRFSRVTLGDGTRLTLRPHAELQLREPEEVALERGEVFCEVVAAAGRKFAVVTPDARIWVSGTQFGVKRADHTEVVVASGEVRVANEKGEALLPAGTGVSVRKASAPAKPHVLDADALAATWRRTVEPPETARFRYDFEDSRKPMPWQDAKVVAGPPRGLNKGCLEGSPGINLDLSRVDKRVSLVHGTLKLRFRYYATGGDSLHVQLFDDRVKDNFRFEVKSLVHDKWEVLEANLSEFFLLIDGAARIQEGDRLTWFNVTVAGTKGPVYFDDIELVEVLK